MQFSTHIQNASQLVQEALLKQKARLLTDLNEGLRKAKQLLRTDTFDYWIQQLATNNSDEIPTTVFGVEQARDIWSPIAKDRKSLSASLSSTCELVLTYCADGDICEFQAEYHYYFHIPTGKVFRESGFGASPDRPAEVISASDTRIARIAELAIPIEELYD